MKRWFSLVLILTVLLGVTPAITHAADSGEAADDQQDELLELLNILKEAIVGTVRVEKAGYMNAYNSDDTKSGIIFRVHHGERFWCTEETENGWYGIQFIDGTTGYVNPNDTALERGVADDQAFSLYTQLFNEMFMVKTVRRADIYSQPKSSAQTRRESQDATTTFYFNAGTEQRCFGKATRENRDWYVFLALGQGGVPEIVWFLASDCEVLEGDPDENIVPSSWYD